MAESDRNEVAEGRERENMLRRKRRADPEYRDHENALARKRYHDNPEVKERTNARQRKRYAEDPDFRERVKANQRKLRADADPEAKERDRSRQRKRYAEDSDFRERVKVNNQKRRKSRRALVSLIVEQVGKCAICRRRLPADLNLIHVDHVWPVSAGGTSDQRNLTAVCAECNLSKGSEAPNGACVEGQLSLLPQ